MDWATYLRRLRRGRGLGQSAFAELLGVSQATVWRWERGISIPARGLLDGLRRVTRPPDTAADKAAIEAVRSSRAVCLLTSFDADRFIMVSDGTCALQRAPRAGLMAVARSRSASEEALRIMADRSMIRGLFTGELAALRVVNLVPSFHGGPGFGLETIWTPMVLSNGTRAFRNDARRATVPLRPMIEAITMEELTESEPLKPAG